jgi:hypothetical protein
VNKAVIYPEYYIEHFYHKNNNLWSFNHDQYDAYLKMNGGSILSKMSNEQFMKFYKMTPEAFQDILDEMNSVEQ